MKQVFGWVGHNNMRFIHGGVKSKEAELLSKTGSMIRVTEIPIDRRLLGMVRRAEKMFVSPSAGVQFT